jgi:hypothetical protein
MTPMHHALLALCLAANAAAAQTIYTWVDEDGTVNYSDTLSGVPQGVKVDTTKGQDFALINVEQEGKEEGQVVQRPAAPAPAPVRTNNASGYISAITGEPLDEYQWRSRFRVALAEVNSLEDDLAIDKKRLNDPASYGYGPGVLCGGYPGGTLPQQPPPYRAQGQMAAMQARATIQPAPGVTVTGDAKLVNGTPAPPPGVQHRGVQSPGYYGGCIATPSPDYERLKDKIERNSAALKRAQEALADLERLASHHGVPREWRKG